MFLSGSQRILGYDHIGAPMNKGNKEGGKVKGGAKKQSVRSGYRNSNRDHIYEVPPISIEMRGVLSSGSYH